MLIDLCGDLSREGHVYRALFRPETYINPTEKIPFYVIIEAFIQIAARSSSAHLFEGRRSVPLGVHNLCVSPRRMRQRPRVLRAVVERLGDFAKVRCDLSTESGAAVADAVILISAMGAMPLNSVSPRLCGKDRIRTRV